MQRALNLNTLDMQPGHQFNSATFARGSNYPVVAKNEVCAMRLPGGGYMCVFACVCVMSESAPPLLLLLHQPQGS